MKLKGSLACLLLFLLLGRGEASPLQGGEEDSGGEVGEAIGHGVGEAFGHVVGEAAIHGLEKARDPHLGDALAHKLKEASHALENSGSEAGRQAENIIGHGVDPAHSSGQGTPGSNGAWGTNGQPSSGGHGTPGSQGSSGGPGDTRDHVFSGGSGGSFGANAQGGPWGQGGHRGPFNLGANSQGAAAQPGSVRGSNRNTECTNPPGPGGSSGNSGGGSNGGSSGSSGSGWDTRNSDHGGSSQEYNPNSSSGSRVGSGGGNKPECDNTHVSGGSGGQGQGSSGEGEAVSGINTLNSQTSSEPFNFDTFWKNFKSKLGFINWDAINKDQRSFRTP
uniref:Dermokine n=1 Tax=Moschus moschiferus TaxID=68415 RepID=A0A8C6CLT3_MOSMO